MFFSSLGRLGAKLVQDGAKCIFRTPFWPIWESKLDALEVHFSEFRLKFSGVFSFWWCLGSSCASYRFYMLSET